MSRFTIPAALILSVTFAQTAIGQSYSDIRNTRYTEAVTYLTDKGAIQGYADGTIRPYRLINRAEAIKVLLTLRPNDRQRVAWRAQHLQPLPLFIDTDQHAWYLPYVETAFETRFITGYPDRTFRPGRTVTVEEGVAMLMRNEGENGFADPLRLSPSIGNQPGAWFTAFINGAIDRNLFAHAEHFVLGRPLTRGQFFDLVYRMDVVKTEHLPSFNRPEPMPAVAPRIPSNATAYTTPLPSEPKAIARSSTPSALSYFSITIPALGIYGLPVGDPPDMSHNGMLVPLQRGVGHLFGEPGQGGKILIYGHSSGYSWDVSKYTKIFRQINRLKAGDRVTLDYGGKTFEYEVTFAASVPAGDMSPYRGGGDELLLYTCWPPDSIKFRYLVHAVPVR